MTRSSIATEYNEINENGRNGWIDKFQAIKEKSEQEAREKKFSFESANKSDNRKLNRYRDVNPYDYSRIVLHRGDADYINANLVTMDKANRKYILTQGPLNTVGHFWLMVWEQNSKAILLLNKIIEKKQVKCHQYWPEQKGPENKLCLTDVGLEVEYLRSEEYKHYTKRILRLSDTESTKSREIIQFHYNTWPDFGIPSSPIEFLQFLKQVRDSNALSADVGPAIVHCSAGIGRSGTFCLVDTCLVLAIKEKSEQEAREKKFSFESANKSDNRKLNRYRDVNPYDYSRIVLHRGDADYINANLVTMDKANRKYILTQGPLNTVGHFWLMVWEQNSKAILLLNKIIEKKQVKCHQYWPEQKGPENKLCLTDVGLEVEYLRSEEYKHYTKRILRLSDTESTKSREIIQFHYNTWPDFGIPSSPIEFLQFLKQVRDSNALSADVGPAIVHCSAGIGRSGTFCLVDTCLVLVENEGENKVSVCDLLLELRRYRMGLIQTFDQLFFSYQAIIDGIKHLNDPSFSDYEEVPVISYNEEDVPPPLPPPRESSLTLKGLPVIPTSVSAHEFRDVEKRKNVDNNINIDRPLPPLPRENSLTKVDESASDEMEDDDSDGYEDSNSSNDTPIKDHCANENNVNTTNGYNDQSSFDADSTLPLSPTDKITMNGTSERSEGGELRRRQRLEKQAVMANKIKEMKRKQQACEEEARKPKKRRQQQSPAKKSVP